IRASATSVTRRTPNRSPTMPAGIETIRIAMLALASRNPDWSGESEKRCAYSGTSGMIALHIASPTNTAANSRRTTGRRTRAECQTACPGRGACRAHTPSRRRPGIRRSPSAPSRKSLALGRLQIVAWLCPRSPRYRRYRGSLRPCHARFSLARSSRNLRNGALVPRAGPRRRAQVVLELAQPGPDVAALGQPPAPAGAVAREHADCDADEGDDECQRARGEQRGLEGLAVCEERVHRLGHRP